MWSKDIIFPCVCFNLSMTVLQVQQHVNVSACESSFCETVNPLCGYKENDGCGKRLIKFLLKFFLVLISLFNCIILVISCLKVCLFVFSSATDWNHSLCIFVIASCLSPFYAFFFMQVHDVHFLSSQQWTGQHRLRTKINFFTCKRLQIRKRYWVLIPPKNLALNCCPPTLKMSHSHFNETMIFK